MVFFLSNASSVIFLRTIFYFIFVSSNFNCFCLQCNMWLISLGEDVPSSSWNYSSEPGKFFIFALQLGFRSCNIYPGGDITGNNSCPVQVDTCYDALRSSHALVFLRKQQSEWGSSLSLPLSLSNTHWLHSTNVSLWSIHLDVIFSIVWRSFLYITVTEIFFK